MILADDQGYGDVACHGNPVIRTPHMDALAAESSALTDYHVAPTCSPTRASLLTGHWTNRTGVWHTINGRSMLRSNETTLATMLGQAGYATGMFGKWHLGDNYPYRAEDRGFDEVYRHGGGGVGQTPDVWDNSYFDGAYFHNGVIEPAQGFCTDVFFDAAGRFIETQAAAGKPFFAYISTNAPHGPLHCPAEWMDAYRDQPDRIAAFFGMITNIDDNLGQTRRLLDRLGIADNTIFVFTTDNGTASGKNVFNAGMRGNKGSPYEGGHRVPFLLRWPDGGMNVAHASGVLTHAVDVVPTLLDLCGVETPANFQPDGQSLRSLLTPGLASTIDPDRFLITDSQRVRDPIKWRQSAVMQNRWRLINGKELYDIVADPGQTRDIAETHPDRVESMRAFYESWWDELEPTFSQTTEIIVGHPDERSTRLTAHDWIDDEMPPWHQGSIRAFTNTSGRRRGPTSDATAKPFDGYWAIDVHQTGRYQIRLSRWPDEVGVGITSGLPAGDDVPGADSAFRTRVGRPLAISRGVLRIDGDEIDSAAIDADAPSVDFVTELSAGSHRLSPYFQMGDSQIGVFYCTLTPVSTN